ncbi:MAG: nicotinate (nicotinamide) nucleotide adenylyltransferase [Thermotaleaceae bacterium]
MKKIIAVFGGAFSPITNAHLALAEQICNEYQSIEKVLFLPVSDCYHKHGLLPAHHRVAMLKELFKTNSKFQVSEVETASPVLLNTMDSLSIIQSQYPEYTISFIMGSDNLKQIHEWHQARKLIEQFKFMIITRNGDEIESIIEENLILKNYKSSFIKVTETIRNDNSSTIVRTLLEQNKSIRYLVPDEVFYYIKEHNLFKE